MPWTEDNGGRSYKPSIFTKDELPAWSEIIDEYYEKIFSAGDHKFDHNNPGELNKYWKVPQKKYIIAMICNQFNKMILEDGFKEDLLKFINTHVFRSLFNSGTVAFDIRFSIRLIHNLGMDKTLGAADKKKLEDLKFKTPELIAAIAGTPPYVYTLTNPNGKTNPFIVNNHPRIDISTITDDVCLYPAIKIFSSTRKFSKDNYTLYTPLPWINIDQDAYEDIIEWMMAPYKEYFEGDAPGWKDKNGTIIESKPSPIIGYDPAL